jgi:phospholipid transport system transporter-binding protein
MTGVAPAEAQGAFAPVQGGFLIDEGAWRYEGALTLDNAAQVMAAADAQPLPPGGVIDLAGLARADSAALAVILALRRRAAREATILSVRHLPASLTSLAMAYGVDELVRDPAA